MCTSFFMKAKIITFIFIKYLLIVNKYKSSPKDMATNMKNRNWPLLNMKSIIIRNIPVSIPNNMSSIYVTISDVLNDFLNTLNMSNPIPITIPQSMYIENK